MTTKTTKKKAAVKKAAVVSNPDNRNRKARWKANTKYRHQMERAIDKERDDLKKLKARLEDYEAPAACIASVSRAIASLDMADAKLN